MVRSQKKYLKTNRPGNASFLAVAITIYTESADRYYIDKTFFLSFSDRNL